MKKIGKLLFKLRYDILFALGLIVYVLENIYFGYNLSAVSNKEKFWDSVYTIVMIFAFINSLVLNMKTEVKIGNSIGHIEVDGKSVN